MQHSSLPVFRLSRRGLIVSLFLVGSVLGLLVSTGIFLVLAKWHEELSESWLMTLDQTVQDRLHQTSSPTLTTLMQTLTTLGHIVGLLVLAGIGILAFSFKKRWYEAGSLLVAMGGAALLNQLAKLGFHRPRPTIPWALVQEDGYSFPSGHAMISFVFYGMVVYLLFRLLRRFSRVRLVVIILLILLVGGIGLSRIYLGAHYPSDVVAGWLASGIWLAIVISVTEIARWLYQLVATHPPAFRFFRKERTY